jgi:hypothetical protein
VDIQEAMAIGRIAPAPNNSKEHHDMLHTRAYVRVGYGSMWNEESRLWVILRDGTTAEARQGTLIHEDYDARMETGRQLLDRIGVNVYEDNYTIVHYQRIHNTESAIVYKH